MEDIDKKILEQVYCNLRTNYTKLTDEILGDDYYNTACDTYNCDDMICEDILQEFKKLRAYKFIIQMIIRVCLISQLIALLVIILIAKLNNIWITILSYSIPLIIMVLIESMDKIIKKYKGR